MTLELLLFTATETPVDGALPVSITVQLAELGVVRFAGVQESALSVADEDLLIVMELPVPLAAMLVPSSAAALKPDI